MTAKCDTNLLLLSSHKGKIKEFSVKLLGLQSPRSSSSVTSAVFSSIKKGLSMFNGSAEEEIPSDEDQVSIF